MGGSGWIKIFLLTTNLRFFHRFREPHIQKNEIRETLKTLFQFFFNLSYRTSVLDNIWVNDFWGFRVIRFALENSRPFRNTLDDHWWKVTPKFSILFLVDRISHVLNITHLTCHFHWISRKRKTGRFETSTIRFTLHNSPLMRKTKQRVRRNFYFRSNFCSLKSAQQNTTSHFILFFFTKIETEKTEESFVKP